MNSLIAPNGTGYDAFLSKGELLSDITYGVLATQGKTVIPQRPGQAWGTYTADVTPYIAGFIVGYPWDPATVSATNLEHIGMQPSSKSVSFLALTELIS